MASILLMAAGISCASFASPDYFEVCRKSWLALAEEGESLLDEGTTDLVNELRIALSTPPYMVRDAFDTRFYFSPHLDSHPLIPEMSRSTKGIVIALGGAGGQGSAAAFMANASGLARHGIALISFDYPFHGHGPRRETFKERTYFLNYVLSIIDHLTGRLAQSEAGPQPEFPPVVILGHSFGNTLIQELLTMRPRLAQAVFLVSPAGYQTPGLLKHYQNFRFSPTRWEEFVRASGFRVNREGALWEEGTDGAGGMYGEFQANRGTGIIDTPIPVFVVAGAPDPDVLARKALARDPILMEWLVSTYPEPVIAKALENPSLLAELVAEEPSILHKLGCGGDAWSTPKLLEEVTGRFPNGKLIVVPGASHHSIFAVREGPERFINNRIVEFFRSTTGQVLERTKRGDDPRVRTLTLYRVEIFRRWFDSMGYKLPTENSDRSQYDAILKEWNGVFRNYYLYWVASLHYPWELVTFFSDISRDGTMRGPAIISVTVDEIPFELLEPSARQRVGAYFSDIAAILRKPSSKLTSDDYDNLMKFVSFCKIQYHGHVVGPTYGYDIQLGLFNP